MANELMVRNSGSMANVNVVAIPDGPAPTWAGPERVPLTFPVKLPGGGAINVKGRFEISEEMEAAVRATDAAALMVALVDTVSRTEEVTLSIVDSAAALALSVASGKALAAGKGKRPMTGKELGGWLRRLISVNATDDSVREALTKEPSGPVIPSGRAPRPKGSRKGKGKGKGRATVEPTVAEPSPEAAVTA